MRGREGEGGGGRKGREGRERERERSSYHDRYIPPLLQLMYPLHSLRQACCHPSIVRNSYLPFNFSKKK